MYKQTLFNWKVMNYKDVNDKSTANVLKEWVNNITKSNIQTFV